MEIQHLDSEMRIDSITYLLNHLVKSASNLVENGMEEFLLQVLEHLERFLSRDTKMYNYNKMQRDFVTAFLFKIKDLGTHTKKVTSKIHLLVKSSNDSPSIQQQRQVMENPQDHLSTLSPVKILRIFASTEVEERSRELAIRKLNLLLSHNRTREEIIDISERKEVKSLIINCLWRKEGISESMFKVLGEVIYHVSCEMNVHGEIWYDLQHYIASNSKTEFQKAVYIFLCLTMLLEDDFVRPIIQSLLPQIYSRLNPPREVSVDNSGWVLAFVGAFCAAVHLTEIQDWLGYIKGVEDLMIDSVGELVERGMEVGLVRRAFRDVEIVVKKQKNWFDMNEYKFIKELFRRLYGIKGMKMESRMVLWRINVFVNRGITDKCND